MDEKFGMGAMGFGPLAGMNETMDFVRRAWSTFNLPSNMAPTLDLDEIDKRIADLRTVEQWLSLNLGMLQSAIQGLEIQRGSIAALKAFGDAVGSPGAMDAGSAAAKAMAAMAAAGGSQTGGAREAAASGASAGTPAPVRAEDDAAPARESKEAPAGPDTQASAAAISPAAWWNLLQSQFSQVAQAAMAGAGAGAAQPPASSTDGARAAKARKPAARKPASGKAAARPRKPSG